MERLLELSGSCHCTGCNCALRNSSWLKSDWWTLQAAIVSVDRWPSNESTMHWFLLSDFFNMFSTTEREWIFLPEKWKPRGKSISWIWCCKSLIMFRLTSQIGCYHRFRRVRHFLPSASPSIDWRTIYLGIMFTFIRREIRSWRSVIPQKSTLSRPIKMFWIISFIQIHFDLVGAPHNGVEGVFFSFFFKNVNKFGCWIMDGPPVWSCKI